MIVIIDDWLCGGVGVVELARGSIAEEKIVVDKSGCHITP
jgi:hypothetical protein